MTRPREPRKIADITDTLNCVVCRIRNGLNRFLFDDSATPPHPHPPPPTPIPPPPTPPPPPSFGGAVPGLTGPGRKGRKN